MKSKNWQILSIGMAMFSMYFGAGNIVFPLLIGQVTTDQTFWALLGLIITAVGVPFVGLFAITLYNGDYKQFFARLGKWPSFILVILLMGCIGPFGAIPRCIALSYANTKMFFDMPNIIPFSIAACGLIFAATVKKTKIMDIVGWMLTPFFLLSIGFIVIAGIVGAGDVVDASALTPSGSFVYGLTTGYNTMDLLGSFFFCMIVNQALHTISTENGTLSQKHLAKNGLYSCLVGAFLLALVYIGMCYVSAFHSAKLAGVQPEVLIGNIALHVLGPYAGITTCVAVIIATLTTAIALSSIFAEFLQKDVLQERVSYKIALIATLIITFFVSTLEFSGIVKMLVPIVQMIYPLLLVFSIINIAYKLWGFDKVKTPLVTAVGVSLLLSLY